MTSSQRMKWVKALRSGEYRQGEGYLSYASAEGFNSEDLGDEGDKYCCLGVAKELFGLPSQCNTYIDDKAKFADREAQQTLATLNDKPWSFKKIADVIELIPLKDLKFSALTGQPAWMADETAEGKVVRAVSKLLTAARKARRER
jgi:hypothetical protein